MSSSTRVDAPGGSVDVTLTLRPKEPIPDRYDASVSRDEFERRHSASTDDLAAVAAFASANGLTVRDASLARRAVTLSGPREALEKALGPTAHADISGEHDAALPASLQGRVTSVLGMDEHAIGAAHPLYVVSPRAADDRSLSPLEVARAYRFPASDGTGRGVAVISLGGRVDTATQNAFLDGLRVPRSPIEVVKVDGGSTNASDDGATAENTLDTEVIGALAPGARKTVYAAPNSDRGFVDAIETALHDPQRRNDVISISWGSPEDAYAPNAREALSQALKEARAMGVAVFAASGDNGSTDGVDDGKQHVDFPAASPDVVAAGGTTLRLARDGSIASETVWNGQGATGGGISALIPLPPYQKSSNVPPLGAFAGRGVPDVAGDADPATGFEVLLPPASDGSTNGEPSAAVIGGTSAVAPLYAALTARVEQRLGRTIGDAPTAIYGAPPRAFRDVITGGNGAYHAAPGWDPVTGRGSIVGDAWLASLAATPAGAVAP